jgi:hypothetical protein
MIDDTFDLRLLWAPFEEEAILQPLAGLQPAERRIVINEQRRAWFDEHPGALNFTLAHELGHWDLHVDHAALGHPLLDGMERAGVTLCRSSLGVVEVLLTGLLERGVPIDEAYTTVHSMTRGTDDFFMARQANRYAGALLMPWHLIDRATTGRDLLAWPTIYRLAEEFLVTTTAMKIRLESLGRIFVAPDRSIHLSEAEFRGQARLL